MSEFFLLSGIPFLFRFLPVFLVVYYLTPASRRNTVLYLGSLVFYAMGEGFWVLLLFGLTLVNHFTGAALFNRTPKKQSRRKRRSIRRAKQKKGWVLFAVCFLDGGLLVLFKLLSFFYENIRIPVGLSFFVFKMLALQIDLYRGRITKKPVFAETAAYFTLFPQLTQGPIMRYEEGFPGNRNGRPFLELFEEGLFFLAAGFSMKILLADKLGAFWNTVYGLGAESLSTPLAWLGAYAYTFRLYFDFWGYSLMAAGIGIMLGFPFIRNFNHPYAAVGVSDFYRRWHVTLGTWFRDYLYIPLGGSRKGVGNMIRNLLIVWLCTGFWHGSSLNYLLWGVLLGLMVVVEKCWLKGILKKCPIIGRLWVWFFIPLTWVVFAIPDFSQMGYYFGRLFPFLGIGKTFDPLDFLEYLGILVPLMGAGLLLMLPKVFAFLEKHRRNILVCLGLTAVFWYGIYTAAISEGQAFLYFNF